MANELKWSWLLPLVPGVYVHRPGPASREAAVVYLNKDTEGRMYVIHPDPVGTRSYVDDWMDGVHWYGPLPGVP